MPHTRFRNNTLYKLWLLTKLIISLIILFVSWVKYLNRSVRCKKVFGYVESLVLVSTRVMVSVNLFKSKGIDGKFPAWFVFLDVDIVNITKTAGIIICMRNSNQDRVVDKNFLRNIAMKWFIIRFMPLDMDGDASILTEIEKKNVITVFRITEPLLYLTFPPNTNYQ